MVERQIRAAGVETAEIEPESGSDELIAPGVFAVPPQQLRMVAAPAAGLVEMSLVAPDEEVREGEPIARLKSSELAEAQRALLHADADAAALAEEKLQRDEQLFREKLIAERRLPTTRVETTQARSYLAGARRAVAPHGRMADAGIVTLRRDRRAGAGRGAHRRQRDLVARAGRMRSTHHDRNFVFLRVAEGLSAAPVTVVSETSQSATLRGPLSTQGKAAVRGVLTLLEELAAADR